MILMSHSPGIKYRKENVTDTDKPPVGHCRSGSMSPKLRG
jgi:hypothetical protein